MIADKLAQVHPALVESLCGRATPRGKCHAAKRSKTFQRRRRARGLRAGERRFGENYVQEASTRSSAGRPARSDRMASDRPVAKQQDTSRGRAFDWVHSVDRLKIAERLSEQRPAHLPPLAGVPAGQHQWRGQQERRGPGRSARVGAGHRALPRLRLRGLMAIPEPVADEASTPATPRTARADGRAERDGLALDTLSMGMSADLEAAIAEGATLVAWVPPSSADAEFSL